MIWQDWVISIGNMVLALALIPSILGKDKPAVATSLVTALVLIIFGFSFYTLELFYSAVIVSISAFIWLVLFFQKKSQNKN